MTILGQPGLQLVYLRHKRLHLLVKGGILGFQCGDFFGWRHASTLHLLCKSGSYHGGEPVRTESGWSE